MLLNRTWDDEAVRPCHLQRPPFLNEILAQCCLGMCSRQALFSCVAKGPEEWSTALSLQGVTRIKSARSLTCQPSDRLITRHRICYIISGRFCLGAMRDLPSCFLTPGFCLLWYLILCPLTHHFTFFLVFYLFPLHVFLLPFFFCFSLFLIFSYVVWHLIFSL